MSRLRRPAWLRLPATPAGRAGSSAVTAMMLITVLAVGTGVGYTVSRPLLGDGSSFLSRGHTVAHVNGETGKSDAQTAAELATGNEPVQTVRLPDGRVAIVNKATGTTTIIDGSTMAPTGPPIPHSGPGGDLEAVATDSGGYLVDKHGGTVSELAPPGRTPAPAVVVPRGIVAAVPSGDSVWVLTKDGQVAEVARGRVARTVRLPAPVSGITVADGHPVAVTAAGRAYVVDSDRPHAVGDLGLSGSGLALGSWRGAGRYVLAVERATGRVAVLDPRTGRTRRADLPAPSDARLDAPVVLGSDVYVPDYTGPRLWRVDAATGAVRPKPLPVPGRPGDVFDLTVSGGRVWANSQYDRRALIVDGDGRDHTADKGAGPDVRDSQAGHEPAPPVRKAPKAGGPPPGPPGTRDGRPGTRDDGRPESVGRPSKRRPVAPLRAPSVIGLSRKAACRLIKAARLTCVPRTDPAPVTDPGGVGVVSAQQPAAGATPADKKVGITYPDHFVMPSVRAQNQGEACALLKKYTMTCHAAVGAPASGANRPGTVYQQTPAAGAVVAMDSRADLLYYSGTGTVHSYAGQNIDAACAQVQADGFECRRQEGTTANGTGQQPGTVYQQDPPPNTRRDVKQPVTLTYRSDRNTLPNTVGKSPDEACTELQTSGFVCDRAQQLFASTNKVEAQEPASGTAPLGTAVTVRYSPWQVVDYWIYQKNDADVWALRPQGDVPAGYGRQSFRVGGAYRAGEDIPGGRGINGFFCTAGGGRCNGLDVNHFYSRVTSYADPHWQGPSPAATFMDCGTAGTKQIFRVWKDAGGVRLYGITDNPGAWGAQDQEMLGCVWP